MTWTCEQTEARLSDYLDGVLSSEELAEFRAHLPGCPRCAPLVASVSGLLIGLQSMEQLEAPPRLVYAILDQTLGPRETVQGWRGMLAWIRRASSIRVAYGALSVAATLILFVTAAGFNWRHPKLADLQPAMIYRKADQNAHLAYARSAKFINDLRVVNDIQTRLREQSEIPTNTEGTTPRPEKQPGSSDGSQPITPRQQNRANDLARHIEVLAMAMPFCNGSSGL